MISGCVKVIAMLACIGINLSSSAQVQNIDTINLYKLTLEELLSLPVVSSSKVEQKIQEAPNIVVSMPVDIFYKYGFRTVNEVLFSQPAYFISQDYERQTVGFRGMFEGWNNNHQLLLIDGMPFNDNLYGTAYTWEITPLTFAKSLEVIFGPGGALYGSYAMNGVVSLITHTAKDLEGVGRASLRLGSNRLLSYDIISGSEGDNLGIVVSYSQMSTNGNEYLSYDARDSISSGGSYRQRMTNDARDGSYFFTKIYGKNKYDGLVFQLHQQNWGFQTGHGWLFVIPDRPEDMNENRTIIVLKYSPSRTGEPFRYELGSRFQTHRIDWNMRFYNDNAFGYYPNGVSELLKTAAHDLFTRGQVSYAKQGFTWIAGIENSVFLYSGDDVHSANIDMNTWSPPSASQQHYALNPWLEFIKGKPVYNLASYTQVITPRLLDRAQFTISYRYDRMFFNYYDLTKSTKDLTHKSYQMLTPRVALVLFLNKRFTLKAIYSKAFRTPTPTELFGFNTFTLASNINELKPELVTNYDFSVNWEQEKLFSTRLNLFWMNFENTIAYSVANENLSTNIYSLKSAGAELYCQLLAGNFTAYSSYSYTTRLNENVLDSTISPSKTRITWAPNFHTKFGLLYKNKRWSLASTAYYQGKVYRRASDKFLGMEKYRPFDYVDSWCNLNLRLSFRITPKSEVGLEVNNLLNAHQGIIKNNPYRFDYQLNGRNCLVEFALNF